MPLLEQCTTSLTPRLICRLDYPGIGPEHSYLSELGRAEYFAVTDRQALDAFVRVSRLEGIIPALETSHAFAYLEVGSAACQAAFAGQSLPGAVRLHHLCRRVASLMHSKGLLGTANVQCRQGVANET